MDLAWKLPVILKAKENISAKSRGTQLKQFGIIDSILGWFLTYLVFLQVSTTQKWVPHYSFPVSNFLQAKV